MDHTQLTFKDVMLKGQLLSFDKPIYGQNEVQAVTRVAYSCKYITVKYDEYHINTNKHMDILHISVVREAIGEVNLSNSCQSHWSLVKMQDKHFS